MTEQNALADAIIAEVHRQTSEDAIRKLVEEKIGVSVKSAVDNAFRWGDVGKQIEKAVTNSLAIGDRLDVPAYGNMVMAVLRSKMDEVLGTLVNERLAAEMTEILSLAPREVKLSTLVEVLVKQQLERERWGTSITCEVEDTDYGGHWIYIDPDSGKKTRECELQIGVSSEGKIFYLVIDRKDAKHTVVFSDHDPYKKLVFAAYACGSKFIVDADHVVTGVGDD